MCTCMDKIVNDCIFFSQRELTVMVLGGARIVMAPRNTTEKHGNLGRHNLLSIFKSNRGETRYGKSKRSKYDPIWKVKHFLTRS